ncbi:MAG: hypothetical protein RR348_03730 [Clostridia bacterium]
MAILDIGSHKLVFAVARKSSKGIYNIKNFASLEYPGFFEGRWVESEMLGADISRLLDKSGYKKELKTIYVGVPSNFVKVVTQERGIDFGKEKIVTTGVVEDFLSTCGEPSDMDSKFMVISSSVTKYTLDDNKEVLCAIDERASRLKAIVSYILCQKSFCTMFDTLLTVEGFENIAYISSAWAQNCKLLDFDTKNKGAIVVDVGFVTTSFSYQKGEGIDFLKTVSMGGANVADDLANSLYCDFFEARRLALKVNLDIDDNAEQELEITISNEQFLIGSHNVNHIVKYRLDMFVEFILNCAANLDKPLKKIPMFISGGGLTSIRGAVPYIEKQLKHTMRVLVADIPQYDKSCDSSFVAVIDVANEINSNKKKLKKLFG